jgi:hypothetical protein
MEDIDTHETNEQRGDEDDDMFLQEVIQGEHELLFLDSYLRDVFGNSGTI